MLHVTCDHCGIELHPGEDHHYVVKIEGFAVGDPAEITEFDLDDDHLEEISQILTDMQDDPGYCPLTEPTKHFRYDLCMDCYKRFTRNPLARGQLEKLNFSEN